MKGKISDLKNLHLYQKCEHCFLEQHSILWAGVSRTVNLLAMLNVSMFFLPGAVKANGDSQGHYYPVISLALLSIAGLLVLMHLAVCRTYGAVAKIFRFEAEIACIFGE